MIKTAIGGEDIWVFRRDPVVNRKKANAWAFGCLMVPLLMIAGVVAFPHPFILAILALISLVAFSFCFVAFLSTRFHAKHGLIELDGYQLREKLNGRVTGRYDLRGTTELVAIQDGFSDPIWLVKYGDGIPLCLKPEWLEFNTLIEEIEKRSGRQFTLQKF